MLMEQVYKTNANTELILKCHEQFAVQIGISASVFQVSIKLWRAVFDLNPELDLEATQWFAAIVLISALNSRISSESRLQVNVTTLLRKSNMSVLSLMNKLKYLREIVYLSQRSIDGILDFQRKFCVSAAIFDRFCKIYGDIFAIDVERSNEELDQNYVFDIPEPKQACWLIYLLAKDEMPIAHTQIFLSFQVLLCAIDFVMRGTQKFLLLNEFSMALENESQTVEAFSELTPVLKLLCNKYGCDASEMVHVKKKLDSTFFVSFLKKSISDKTLSSSLAGDIFLPNSNELHGRYWEILDRYFELDETLFLAQDPIIALQNSSQPSTKSASKKSENSLESDHPKPLDENPVIEQNSSSSNELNSNLRSEIDQLLANLDLTLTEILSNFFTNSEKLCDSNVDDLKENCKKLMFEVVEAINKKQPSETASEIEDNFSVDNLDCLYAICVISCLVNTFPLPVAQNSESQIDDVKALTVLESLRISLPLLVKKIDIIEEYVEIFSTLQLSRLKCIEERCIEFHVFKDSSFIKLFMQQKTLSKSTAYELENGRKVYLAELAIFSNKICRLAYRRLQQLCKLLNIVSELEAKIWECFEHCLFERTFLFENRHLDQIVMCSIYAICKVSDNERKFKNITQAYRKIPNTAAEVFKKVKIFEESNSYDSIIAFYNKVFMQTLKNFILQYSTIGNSEANNPEQQPTVTNVLKRVNPNVLIRNALNKPAVHQPPAISTCSGKGSQITGVSPKFWPTAPGGLPSDEQLPLRHMASAIVANKEYQQSNRKNKYTSRETKVIGFQSTGWFFCIFVDGLF